MPENEKEQMDKNPIFQADATLNDDYRADPIRIKKMGKVHSSARRSHSITARKALGRSSEAHLPPARGFLLRR